MTKGFEIQNLQVLCLLQASLGLISPNVRLVSLIPRGVDVTLLFLLEKESEEDRECAAEIASDYSAFTFRIIDGEYELSVQVIGDRELTPEDKQGRLIYVRKSLSLLED